MWVAVAARRLLRADSTPHNAGLAPAPPSPGRRSPHAAARPPALAHDAQTSKEVGAASTVRRRSRGDSQLGYCECLWVILDHCVSLPARLVATTTHAGTCSPASRAHFHSRRRSTSPAHRRPLQQHHHHHHHKAHGQPATHDLKQGADRPWPFSLIRPLGDVAIPLLAQPPLGDSYGASHGASTHLRVDRQCG